MAGLDPAIQLLVVVSHFMHHVQTDFPVSETVALGVSMMLSDEEAKAAQAIAKTTQEVLPLLRDFGRFVARVIGGPLEQGAGIIEDRLKYVRYERQIRLMDKANQFIQSLDCSDKLKPVPLNVAIPLLQAATLEENDGLQDKWAKLLVNAMDPQSHVEVRRHFISILEDFGPLEAFLLEKIVSAPHNAGTEGHVRTERLPDAYLVDEPDDKVAISPRDDVEIALWNLTRLGCISLSMTWGGLSITQVKSTLLGRTMVAACRLRNESETV